MLNRRLLMAQAGETPPIEDWDDEWDYTQGPAEESGFLYFEPKGISEMTPEGQLIANSSESFNSLCWLQNKTNTVKSGVVEVEFIPKRIRSSGKFRIILSKGNEGCQVWIANNAVGYIESRNSPKQIAPIEEGEITTVRMVMSEQGWNQIFLNGESVLKTNVASTHYTNYTALTQHGPGETILRKIKYKYNRVD